MQVIPGFIKRTTAKAAKIPAAKAAHSISLNRMLTPAKFAGFELERLVFGVGDYLGQLFGVPTMGMGQQSRSEDIQKSMHHDTQILGMMPNRMMQTGCAF